MYSAVSVTMKIWDDERKPLLASKKEHSSRVGSCNEIEVKKRSTFAQLKPFLRIAYPYFRDSAWPKCQLICLVILTLLDSGVMVLFSYVKRDLYNSFSDNDESQYYREIAYFFGVLVIAVPLSVLYK